MRMRKKWYSSLFRRRMLVILLLLIQILFIMNLIINGTKAFVWINWVLTLLSIAVALHVLNKRDKDAFKLTWIFLTLLFPIFGGLFYLMFNYQSSTMKFHKKLNKIENESKQYFLLPGDCYDSAEKEMPEHINQIRYLQKFAGFPIYEHTQTKYLSPGEKKFKALVEELKKAEKYIFLEYFIIHSGEMWDTVLEILEQKAAQGVDVRVLYDDVGCFFLLPTDYPKLLNEMGIKCALFNPFRPFLTAKQNNRDHRKIAVIDGKVAFTGGVNLSDEYINKVQKYGHWKDASIMLKGEAAWSLTLIFLQLWSLSTKPEQDYTKYFPYYESKCDMESDGFVQPYADSPNDYENVGEHVYLQIINNAKNYVYITTPYLIIDDSLVSALSLAAKSGVDVRIITPSRWDKLIVHITTRSYYRELIAAGVKIYEYSSGFIHSKTFISDDEVATVGTTNLDFRSLYLHFECGVWMYKSQAVMQVYDDFISTLDKCHEITPKDCKHNAFMRFIQDVLRLFAPLM